MAARTVLDYLPRPRPSGAPRSQAVLQRPAMLPPRVVRLPTISLPQSRAFLNFVRGALQAARTEYEVERDNSLTFGYLLDFDILFDFIAPFMRTGAIASSTLENFSSISDFFGHLKEPFGIPLGTYYELSDFLRKQRLAVRNLHSATQATSVDSALESVREYFLGERFIESTDPILVRDSLLGDSAGSATEEVRLGLAQAKALELLSQSEQGLSRLHSILTHPCFVNVIDLIARNPFRIPRRTYSTFLAALDSRRADESRHTANKVDAYNISFTTILNQKLSEATGPGSRQRSLFFRLLTNTGALFGLGSGQGGMTVRGLSVELPSKHRVDLLENTDEVIAKRAARKQIDEEGLRPFLEIEQQQSAADRALSLLSEVASREGSSVEDLFERLYDPKSNRDRELLFELEPAIQRLDSFLRPSRRIVEQMIQSSVRRSLPAIQQAEGRERRVSTVAAASVAALSDLLNAVQRLLEQSDTLGFELSPFQVGDDSSGYVNPVISFEKLGFSVRRTKADRTTRWAITNGRTEKVAFVVEKRANHWAFHWPNCLPGAALVDFVGTSLWGYLDLTGVEPGNHLLSIIDLHGHQVKERVSAERARELLETATNAAFIRVDTAGATFLAELFCQDPDHVCRVALMLQQPDLKLTMDLFSRLSADGVNMLFRKLLGHRLFGIVSGDDDYEAYGEN